MVDAVCAFCVRLGKLFVQEIDHDNEELAFAMRYVLDPNMTFYRQLGTASSGMEESLVFEPDQGWRKALKPGDPVDILRAETVPVQFLGWATGRIDTKNEQNVKVVQDGEEETMQLATDSHDLAPYGSRSFGKEWRLGLKKDDLVDCLDTSAIWYQSTILDVKEEIQGEKKAPKVLVAYRIYTAEGMKKDKEGRAYNGWSNTYDEWINVYSIRIQRYGTIAKIGGIACKKSLDEDEKSRAGIDDTLDILVNSAKDSELFCVTRPDKVRSETPIIILNSFGREGGFRKMLQRINDRVKPVAYGTVRGGDQGIDFVYYYLDIVGTAWNVMHRKFAQTYVPEFKEAVTGYFEWAPDLEIRKVQKDRVDKIMSNLECLLRRVYTVVEKYRILETFELSLDTLFLKSNYLQLRIDGLKGINDICRNTVKGLSRSLTEQFLADWIREHKVLDELFGPRKHQQILQRSATLIRFVFDHGERDVKLLESLWDYTADEQLRPDTFRVICEIGFPIQSSELEFFAKRIVAMGPGEICEEALDVLYEPHRSPTKTVEQLLKYAGMLFSIGFRPDYPLAISEKAVARYTEMIGCLDYDPYKKEVLVKCVNEMLKQGKNSVLALKLMRRVINQYVGVSVSGIPNTKSSIIEYLSKTADLIGVFFSVPFPHITPPRTSPHTTSRRADGPKNQRTRSWSTGTLIPTT